MSWFVCWLFVKTDWVMLCVIAGEPFNPIKQDIKHGKLRFQKYGDYFVNYGAFPQTWEDPKHTSPETKHHGDNDPIDVCEIGTRQHKIGSIVTVKILGIIALIDDGETDWKVIAISIADPLAHVLNDIDDVDQHLPGMVDAIRTYLYVTLHTLHSSSPLLSLTRALTLLLTSLTTCYSLSSRDYKSGDGVINNFALGGQALPRAFATKVVEETHTHWQSLHKSGKGTVDKQ